MVTSFRNIVFIWNVMHSPIVDTVTNVVAQIDFQGTIYHKQVQPNTLSRIPVLAHRLWYRNPPKLVSVFKNTTCVASEKHFNWVTDSLMLITLTPYLITNTTLSGRGLFSFRAMNCQFYTKRHYLWMV